MHRHTTPADRRQTGYILTLALLVWFCWYNAPGILHFLAMARAGGLGFLWNLVQCVFWLLAAIVMGVVICFCYYILLWVTTLGQIADRKR